MGMSGMNWPAFWAYMALFTVATGLWLYVELTDRPKVRRRHTR